MSKVIVVATNYASALGVIRALGVAGYDVCLISLNKNVVRFASKSRYVKSCYMVEPNFDSIYSAMEEIRDNDERVLVLPIFDIACMLLDEHGDELYKRYDIPNLNFQAGLLSVYMDKIKQKQLAKETGLSIARGNAYSTNQEGILQAQRETEYPCFIKVLVSANVKNCKELFAVCRDSSELETGMRHAAECGCKFMVVEQYLEKQRELSAYGLAFNGRVYIGGYVETIQGGYGVETGIAASGVVIPSEALKNETKKIEAFVKEIGLTGLFCVDLIQSDNKIFFSEINMRNGGSGYSLTLAGANLPGALADLCYKGYTDLSVRVMDDIHFVNEKIVGDAFSHGYITYIQYKQLLQGGNSCFLKNTLDPNPYREWCKMNSRRILKKRIKDLLKIDR